MNPLEDIFRLIDACTEEEQRTILRYLRTRVAIHPLESEWDLNAETILSAISRSSDLTLRGIRGIIAEATFADIVVPQLDSGWATEEIRGDQPYDFLVRQTSGAAVRIQVKLQRKEKQEPKIFAKALRKRLVNPPDILYVVEVQRTRTGKRSLKNAAGETLDETKIEDTRPYRYGDFDILAVNMHPSTRDWRRFMYTVADWLLPRPDPSQIQVMQPVAVISDSSWTDDLSECFRWLTSGQTNRLYGGITPMTQRPDELREDLSFISTPEE
jgi:hypothetical protein